MKSAQNTWARLGTHLVARSTAATENKRFGFGDREMLWY